MPPRPRAMPPAATAATAEMPKVDNVSDFPATVTGSAKGGSGGKGGFQGTNGDGGTGGDGGTATGGVSNDPGTDGADG